MNRAIEKPDLHSLYPLLFLVGFAGLWCLACLVFSRVGAWHKLARQFTAITPPEGQSFGRQSGKIGTVSYGRCLTIHGSAEGLHIAVWFLWRPGHPPLFIPWTAMQHPRIRKFLRWEYVELEVLTPAPVRLQLSSKVFAAHPDQNWINETDSSTSSDDGK